MNSLNQSSDSRTSLCKPVIGRRLQSFITFQWYCNYNCVLLKFNELLNTRYIESPKLLIEINIQRKSKRKTKSGRPWPSWTRSIRQYIIKREQSRITYPHHQDLYCQNVPPPPPHLWTVQMFKCHYFLIFCR